MLIEELKGITPAKIKQFNKKEIYTVEQLALFLPRDYVDCTKLTPLSDGQFCVVKIHTLKLYETKGAKGPVIRIYCEDIFSKAKLSVFFFNQKFMINRVAQLIGKDVICAGKASYSPEYKNWSIANPFLFTSDSDAMKIYPVYSKISGMSDEYLKGKIVEALRFAEFPNSLAPERYSASLKLPVYKDAIQTLHFPESFDKLEAAKKRLDYEDLQYFSTKLQWNIHENKTTSPYRAYSLKMTNGIINKLPFELTDDQKNTISKIINSSKMNVRNNALVQGDVGCGKSIVAYLSITSMADNGYQSILMAPTQVLAEQHFNDFKRYTEGTSITCEFVGGNCTASQKKKIYSQAKSGKIDVLIGTHALINDELEMPRLALIVVDEEHKFGVEQRNKLLEKGKHGVHYIKMSATPIPRSLATTIYGNSTQLYSIKTMPKGRKPVITKQVHNQESVDNFIIKQISHGKQVYVVCPMIDDNEKLEGVSSVEEISKHYSSLLEPLGFKTATLTGKTKSDDFQNTISDFKKNNINLLVSTTVIEVGVNVPNATVMIIHSAERFGLSGLHQLRGRVGRGDDQSYCLLFSEDTENQRLETMCRTNDGFEIAEADLNQRGTGELIGSRQSGDDKFLRLMIANPNLFNFCTGNSQKMIERGEAELSMEDYEKNILMNSPKTRMSSKHQCLQTNGGAA